MSDAEEQIGKGILDNRIINTHKTTAQMTEIIGARMSYGPTQNILFG